MWATAIAILLAGALIYTIWLAILHATRAGAAERELAIVRAQLYAERQKVGAAIDAERAVRDDIDAGGLLNDDGFRRD